MRNINPNGKQSASQEKQILAWLQSGKSITPLEALTEFNCMRLQARIHEIEEKGFRIIRDWFVTPSGKKVRKYSLA